MKESVKNERQQKVYKERKVWKKVWRMKGSKKFIKKERYERKGEERKAAKSL